MLIFGLKKSNLIKPKYLNNKKGLIPGKNQYNVTIINALNEEYLTIINIQTSNQKIE